MADETQGSAPKPGAGAAAEPKPADEAPRFSRERLLSREGQQITGHPVHVLEAALRDDDRAEFTRSEVKVLADDFLKAKVTTAEADR